MRARIYSPAKSAMQSGKGKTKKWLMAFELRQPRQTEPLMGYTSQTETLHQLRLSFDSKDEAINYATQHDIAYHIEEPRVAKKRKIAYSDNFSHGRLESWTH